jgi:hypothetical protein
VLIWRCCYLCRTICSDREEDSCIDATSSLSIIGSEMPPAPSINTGGRTARDAIRFLLPILQLQTVPGSYQSTLSVWACAVNREKEKQAVEVTLPITRSCGAAPKTCSDGERAHCWKPISFGISMSGIHCRWLQGWRRRENPRSLAQESEPQRSPKKFLRIHTSHSVSVRPCDPLVQSMTHCPNPMLPFPAPLHVLCPIALPSIQLR